MIALCEHFHLSKVLISTNFFSICFFDNGILFLDHQQPDHRAVRSHTRLDFVHARRALQTNTGVAQYLISSRNDSSWNQGNKLARDIQVDLPTIYYLTMDREYTSIACKY